jgi:hypothetical protein
VGAWLAARNRKRPLSGAGGLGSDEGVGGPWDRSTGTTTAWKDVSGRAHDSVVSGSCSLEGRSGRRGPGGCRLADPPRQKAARCWACLYSCSIHIYRCPNGPPGTDSARTRFGPVRIGPGQARPVDASGRVGLAYVPRDMPKPGTHREKSCRAGPLARWASTDRTGHWPEPTVERYINTYI